MKIKEVSELCGLSIDTIRYYERVGLVKVQKQSYFKLYDNETVETLIAIKRLRFAGLTVNEIKKIVGIDKEANNLNAKEINIISNIIKRAISTTDEKLKQIYEVKQLLKKMKNKLHGVNCDDC